MWSGVPLRGHQNYSYVNTHHVCPAGRSLGSSSDSAQDKQWDSRPDKQWDLPSGRYIFCIELTRTSDATVTLTVTSQPLHLHRPLHRPSTDRYADRYIIRYTIVDTAKTARYTAHWPLHRPLPLDPYIVLPDRYTDGWVDDISSQLFVRIVCPLVCPHCLSGLFYYTYLR